jgi:hypothetical protein
MWRFAKLVTTWRYNSIFSLTGQEGVEIWSLFTHISALKRAAGLLCVVKRCRVAALESVLAQVQDLTEMCVAAAAVWSGVGAWSRLR